MVATTYIDNGSPLGGDIITVFKGATQFVVGVVDEALNPSNGNVQLAAVGITVALIGMFLAGLYAVKKHGMGLLKR